MTELSSSELTTSSTLNLTRSVAGTSATTAPAAAPATAISSMASGPGIGMAPTKQLATAPASNCPSAPMFQNFARKATATASPVKIIGAARTSVSVIA